MTTVRAPKQWPLGKDETINTFQNWKQNILYTLSLDPNFAPFLVGNFQWQKKSKNAPYRGFTDDGEDVAERKRKTKEQKATLLELMLGQIANYCPLISRNSIVDKSTSMEEVWQKIRLHYGFQSTGAHFIDFTNIKLEPGEKPEDLYQRLVSFVEDSLLKHGGGISHNGDPIDEDEELTPTLENFIVLTWLRLLHSDLPRLVKQRYGTELRSRTLTSIKPEISQALHSLLEEIHTMNDAKVMRSQLQPFTNSPRHRQPRQVQLTSRPSLPKKCPLCKEAGRPDNHFLSKCKFLPERDRNYLAKARQIIGSDSDDEEDPSYQEDLQSTVCCSQQKPTQAFRVQIRQSPYLDTFHKHHHVRLTIDSGATGNMIRLSTAVLLDAKIQSTSQSAHQADGSSPLNVVGETRLFFTRDDHSLYFEGLVVDNLDVDILAGIPFMEYNDISVRPAKRQLVIGGQHTYPYGSNSASASQHSIRRAITVRAASTTTIWPGEYIEINVPSDLALPDQCYAIEPHHPSPNLKTSDSTKMWPCPDILHSVSNKVRIPNLTPEPLTVKRHEHLCQIRPAVISDNITSEVAESCIGSKNSEQQLRPKKTLTAKNSVPYSSTVQLNPHNVLTKNDRQAFLDTLSEFDNVFSPSLPGYNGKAGPFQATVNMGPVLPPQRKGRLPQYSRNQLSELQEQFNLLEEQGVFIRPEEIGVTVEYLNPSFLVKKPNGGFRLVTAFADVGRYTKPQPSLMPNVDGILRHIAQWKYIAVSDLTKSFYQIPLSKSSMKYCGVVTPFRGVRVYTRSAMGMPGSETALEELMCRVLGDLLEEGVVVKLADDLYCGGNSPEDLLNNWTRVLAALQKCNLKLSPTKTIIAPKTTNILGWVWEMGKLKASPHRIATLSSCCPPEKVSGLKSFIGAVKVLSRVVPGCASLIAPLDDAIAGQDSTNNVRWTDELLANFKTVQDAVSSHETIHLPRPNDILWIVTDGAVKNHGVGATLYATRDNKLLLCGFFSAKLRGRQASWIPCEIEALSIAIAVKHFSPYIIQSSNRVCILTDSKPCVMAFEKLCRGEFSVSPRVSTFLSVISRYQLSIRHVKGAAILPSDFASRNAPDCVEANCQLCAFIRESEDSVVRQTSIDEVLNGTSKLPFTGRSTWLAIQTECPDLRRVCAHLKQGTRPSKKLNNIRDVKRYLQVATIAHDGLLVVKRDSPFSPTRDCIIVPRNVLHGILTSLHVQLNHPSCHQLRTVVNRYFFALDMDKAVEIVSENCFHCAALRKATHTATEQTTSEPQVAIGVSFAADVMRRERQFILVLRECVTSYTSAIIIDNERKDSLRDGLLRLCIELRPLDGPNAVVRTDPAPGFQSLVDDPLLRKHRIMIEIGRIKNKNKNPVAERAIQELQEEILRQDPMPGFITPLLLTLSVATLNSRIRNRGLSAREMLTQRDQFSNMQLPIKDRQLIEQQHSNRIENHAHSEASKAPLSGFRPEPEIHVGDLVYLYSDRNKTQGRDRYLVVSCDQSWCNVRKFKGNQLRKASYRVRKNECYKVPCAISSSLYSEHLANIASYSSEEEDENLPRTPEEPQPPSLPDIPDEIRLPPEEDIYPEVRDDGVTPDLHSDNHTPDVLDQHTLSQTLPHVATKAVPSRPVRQKTLPSYLQDYELY